MSRVRLGARFAVMGATLLVGLANVAQAQVRRDGHVVNGGRVAAIAPAPVPVVIVAAPAYYGGYPYGYAPYGYFPAGAGIQNFPVVMLQDGRVFANFGFGFEHVVRSCSVNGFASGVNGVVATPITGSTIAQPIALQPQIIQPAPAQPTASEQQLWRALYPATVVTALPGPLAVRLLTPSCWSSASGSVFVFRR